MKIQIREGEVLERAEGGRLKEILLEQDKKLLRQFVGARRDGVRDVTHRLQQHLALPVGATGRALSAHAEPILEPGQTEYSRLVVCGAHLSGLPLNHQLTERGGRLLEACATAPASAAGAVAPA